MTSGFVALSTLADAPLITAAAHSGQVWVPDWLVLLAALACIAGAVGVATQSYLKFTKTREELEG